MMPIQPLKDLVASRRLVAGLLAAIFVIGALGAWWLADRADRADREMREDLLDRTRMAAGAVNLERVKALTGTEADLASPDYLRIKEQFAAIRAAEPNCRFVYLMGRKADGTIFLFVDSEPAGSKDESPPGQVYEEVPEGYRRVFDTGAAAAIGPVSDRWGAWVSALVPLTDPQTGALIAVLGMDIAAGDWKWFVAARAALPVGLVLLLLIGLATALFASARAAASPKPVTARLLPLVALITVALVAGAGLLLWQQQSARLAGRTALVSGEVASDFRNAMELQARGLAMAAQPIAMDESVREALAAKDAGRLLSDWRGLFDLLHKEQGLTHFYFSDANRVCLLRVHKPEKSGDTFNRFTALEAERTRKTASGVELGPLGTFTLRVVQPVFAGDRLVGYVELGKEIEDVLASLRAASGVQLAVAIRKAHLSREQWEAGMRLLGREAAWDRLPNSVIIYASQGRLPDAFARLADHDARDRHDHGATSREIADGGRDWRVTASPLADASGAEVGDLLVMNDITDLKAAYGRTMALGGLAGAVLLAALLGLTLVMLRRTDAGIRAQQAVLRESEEHLSATLRSIGDGVIACDTEERVASLNRAAEILTGWTSAEAAGQPIQQVFRIIHAQTRETAENPVFRALAEGVNVELANHTALIAKDGAEHQIADSCAPIRDASGAVIGAVLVFLDVTEEYRRREELKESYARYELVLEGAGSGIWDWDVPNRRVHFSARWKQMRGYAEDEVFDSETEWSADIHPEDAPRVMAAVRAHFEGLTEIFEEEYRVRCKDGSYVWILDRGKALRDAAGQVVRMAGSEIDITEQRRAESALKESEQRFDLAISGTGAGLWDWDMVKDTVFFSPRWKSMLGYEDQEVANAFSGWKDLWHPDDAARIEQALNDHLAGKTATYEIEHRLRHKDGGWRWILTRGDIQHDAAGKPVRWTGTNLDITDRKQSEEDLREAEALQRELLLNLAAGVVIVDPVTRQIERINEHAAGLFGAPVDRLLGQRCHALLCPAAEGACPVCDLGQAVDNSERVMLRADGSRLPILKTVKRLTLGGQEKLLECFVDITERKAAERELAEMNAALEAQTAIANDMAAQALLASSAKSEFLANMSHEIRTPMNGVIGMTGLLLDTELTEEQRRYAGIVKSSGESLLGLINDILDFSKIEAGKLELETLDFDLGGLLEDFASTLALRAHDKGLELVCEADPEAPTLLRGDPGRLRQVLTNLAGNALKFTAAGEIAIRVSKESIQEPGVRSQERGDSCMLRFSVRDTGIGIPADKLGLLFDKFTQADASTTRQFGGTGLGLAISKQLAEKLGGEIGVESEPGKGSEFWFTARFELQPEAARVEPPAPADLRGVRVLIVDDNATSREILMTRLSSWGMRPSQVEDGPTALERLHRAAAEDDPFRLAVIDMQMPGMDGETLGRAIKADPRISGTRMVMLTSLGARGDAKAFADLGFSGYLTKPVRHQELRGVLSLALGEAAAAARPIVTRHTAREALPDFSHRKARILLAEDNITNQQVALGILRKFGLSAYAVANGREAVRALETLPYDLVLMDVQMPEMDGLEATRRIRSQESEVRSQESGVRSQESEFRIQNSGERRQGGIPIVAMTAHAMQGDRDRCLEAGMNDYVSKPVSPQALAEVLEKWLPEKTEFRSQKSEVRSQESEVGKQGGSQESEVRSQKAEETPSPVIWDRAGMLARLMDDEELAATILRGFLDDLPRQIEALGAFLKSGDAAGAERQAHTIKGAAANVGGEALRAVAFEMEQAGKAGDLEAVKKRMEELVAAFEELKDSIQKTVVRSQNER